MHALKLTVCRLSTGCITGVQVLAVSAAPASAASETGTKHVAIQNQNQFDNHFVLSITDMSLIAGRRDVSAAGPADRLPAETMDAATQRAAFAAKSLSCQEMVALLGAHTVSNFDSARFPLKHAGELLPKMREAAVNGGVAL